ncbi:MAG: V-type ATP synthase subunit E family protein [Clostridium sp.]
MSNINNITSKILKDAEERKDSILATAENEKKSIVSKSVEKANALAKEIVTKAELEAKSKKERVISGANLKVRNNKLAAKQEVIADVFSSSVDALCKLSDEEFLNFVKNTILSLDIEGDENLILNEQGKKLVDFKVVGEINLALQAQGKTAAIKVSETVGNFRGGFILEKNGLEINSTFEALVEQSKDDLEYQVANVLFN